MIPFWTAAQADLLYQMILLLTAAVTVVCSSVMTWMRW